MFCLMAGAGYVAILYYRETKNDFNFYVKWAMAAVRFLTVSFLSFLLLSPLLKTLNRFSEKPVIIFAQDNSLSITTNADSTYYKGEYIRQVNQFLETVGDKYLVETYTFGEHISEGFAPGFTENLTNMSDLFSFVNDKYAHRNVGALIVASDGIYNRGINPLYSSEKFNFPVYTIALGDTNLQRDVIVTKVNYNRVAFMGNEFPVEVLVSANKCRDKNVQLTISKGDEVLYNKSVFISTDAFDEPISLKLKAEEPGIQRYRVKISTVENEISVANNYQDIFIDVLEGKQKILLLAHAPDPDITAIKQALKANINYEVEDFIINDFEKTLQGYNVVILHGLPSAQYQLKELFDQMDAENTPVFYVVSRNTNIQLLNSRNIGINIQSDRIMYNQVQPVMNENFTGFKLSGATISALHYFPPVMSPFGNITVKPSAAILFSQRIGSVNTSEPLIAINDNQGLKSGVILGSGIWKWRLTNYSKAGNHEAFNEIINKMIQVLSTKVDKGFFRVFTKNNFYENENIEFDAELYNDNYELINEPEVNITVSSSEGQKYPFVFDRTESAYSLDAGKLPVDFYSYSARVNRGDKQFTESGEFTVSSLSIEKTNTRADHNYLYNLALNRGGAMFYPANLYELVRAMSEREEIKPVIYSEKRYTEILNLPLLLVLLLSLLTAEWFMRKRAGSY